MGKTDDQLAQIRAELDALYELLTEAGFKLPPQFAPKPEREGED